MGDPVSRSRAQATCLKVNNREIIVTAQLRKIAHAGAYAKAFEKAPEASRRLRERLPDRVEFTGQLLPNNVKAAKKTQETDDGERGIGTTN